MNDSSSSVTAEMITSKGVINIELFAGETPQTVANFVNLASQGFYDNLSFHRVINDFMVQGGCPQGTGTGGSANKIMCEHNGAAKQMHDRGTLSMAHAGPNTGSSQFFICHNRQGTQHLDGVHTAFGKVTEGLDILDTIGQGDTFSISLIK
jgi:peptidyl-prolyl cis-trans isomerase B (cyclophilin B)